MEVDRTTIGVATRDQEVDVGSDRAAGRRHRRPWATVVVIALVLAPVAAACISLLGRHWHAGGDQALEMLRIEDVGTRHTPLLGAWSRWGWAHPGPVLFYALAPFYRLFGETGVLVGMGVLNAAAIAGVIVIAHRRGGVELAALAGLMMALLVHSLGVSLLVDIWNPFAAFLPFVLFVMLAWAVLCRDWMMLPVAILVGSSVVQIHAGYIPLVVPLLALAGGFVVVEFVRSRETPARVARSNVQRVLVVAGAVAFVVWLPVVVQQLFGTNGNLHALLAYIRHPTESTAGWTTAFGAFGLEFRPVAAWVDGRDIGLGLTAVGRVWPAALTLAAVVAAGLVAWRRRQRDVAWLCAVVVITVGSAVLATAKLTGPLFVYVTRWWWAAPATANLAIVWAVVRIAGNRILDRVVTALALVAIVVVGLMSVADLPVTFAHPDMTQAIGALERPTESNLDHHDRYLIDRLDSSQLGFVSMGLFRSLEADGFHVLSPPDALSDFQYGSWRVATPDQVDGVISVVDLAESGWQVPSGSQLLASYDPLTPADRARELELNARIRAEMGAAAPRTQVLVLTPYDKVFAESSGASPAEVEQLAFLQQHGDGFAVYLSAAR